MILLYTAIGILLYVCLHCWVAKLNVKKYITENKMTLLLTAGVVLLIQLFGDTAAAAVLMAVLMPVLAGYSLPSLFAKVKEFLLGFFVAEEEDADEQ